MYRYYVSKCSLSLFVSCCLSVSPLSRPLNFFSCCGNLSCYFNSNTRWWIWRGIVQSYYALLKSKTGVLYIHVTSNPKLSKKLLVWKDQKSVIGEKYGIQNSDGKRRVKNILQHIFCQICTVHLSHMTTDFPPSSRCCGSRCCIICPRLRSPRIRSRNSISVARRSRCDMLTVEN